jgi:ankyrin repeat protein
MVPFQDPGGQTAVFWAAMEGHAEALDWLLEHGAPVDATNEGGQTALMGAAMR